MANFTFLSYASRSGSTFLATQLSRRFDVTVVPEFQSAYTLLTMRSDSRIAVDDLIDLVEADPQLTWFSAENAIELGPHPVSPRTAIVAIGRAATSSGRDDRPLLFKLGGAVHIWEHVRHHIPEARAICVIRDGRAVTNSLLRSEAPYLRKTSMGYGDVVRIAKTWRQDVSVHTAAARAHPATIHVVRYEELISDSTQTTQHIADFCSWTSAGQDNTGFAVAPGEAGIHALAGAAPSVDRLSAWQTELSESNWIVVDAVASAQLAENGYFERFPVSRLRRAFELARARVRHARITAKYAAFRLGRLRSLSGIAAKLRLRQARRAGRRLTST